MPPPEPENLPRPGDPARAALGLERWRDRAQDGANGELAAFALALAEDRTGRALLESIFGNSPFLTNCLL